MPVLGPTAPTIEAFVKAVLDDLGVLSTGQPVAAEDADTILARLYPKLQELNARDLGYIDANAITNAQFLPLVKIMAYEMALAFEIDDAITLKKLKDQGGKDGEAEQTLKDIVRLRTPRQTLRCEIFTGRGYGYGRRY